MIRKTLFIFFIVFARPLLAQYEDDSTLTIFDKINEKFFNLPQLINFTTLDLYYGYSVPDLHGVNLNPELEDAFKLGFNYGFTRFYNVRTDPDHFYYASEIASIANISSHMKIGPGIYDGITTDNWRFGLGYRNGYGYDFHNGSYLILYHSGSLEWSTIDFEGMPDNDRAIEIVRKYDERTKFGNSFEAGVLYNPIDNFFLNAGLSHTLVHPGFDIDNWVVYSFGELILQRTIDFFGDGLLMTNGKRWPVINMVAKYALSYMFYKFKQADSFWPFNTGNTVSYDEFKIGVSFIIPKK